MIINPFKLNNSKDYKINVFKNDKNALEEKSTYYSKEIDILNIQKYIVSNFMEYLQKNLQKELKEKIQEHLYNVYNLKDNLKIEKITNNLINKMFGYDILQKYIEDDEITDIRAVKYDSIYVKKRGLWKKVNCKFENNESFEEYIRYCVLKNNSNINFDIPMAIVSDKKYNLRIEAGITPVNSISPNIVIRIHRPNKNVSLESLFITKNMLDSESYKIISNAINNKKNIIISGKGGSGKTTLLRAIIDKLPEELAITTNEETTELYIENKNIIQREVIETREESKKITLEKLMKHTLVMSNDVIIVGELKGAETSSFLDSICTGHMGLATVHSDSAQNTLDRIITLVKKDIKNQQYKELYIAKILASSIDYIIYVSEYKVDEIANIEYDLKKEKVDLKIIYKRK